MFPDTGEFEGQIVEAGFWGLGRGSGVGVC